MAIRPELAGQTTADSVMRLSAKTRCIYDEEGIGDVSWIGYLRKTTDAAIRER
jgi:hypothetical protein